MSMAVSLCVLAASVQAREPSKQEDLRVIEKLLYEKMNDPTFEGDLRFIRGVPLISGAPECANESQYLTSLVLHAKYGAQAQFLPPVAGIVSAYFNENSALLALTEPLRLQIAERVYERVLGVGRAGVAPGCTTPSDGDSTARHVHDHATQHHCHPLTTEVRVGFSPSRSELTTGLHALREVDARLRASVDKQATVPQILATEGLSWSVYYREAKPLELCRRLIDRLIPFILHEGGRNLLVCGYANYRTTTYWMAYDLAAIERRVSIGGGSGSIPYSEFRRRESELRDRDPLLDPLFWDYTSYFVVPNLPAFSLVAVDREPSVITALFPGVLDEKAVTSVVEQEARAASAKLRAPAEESDRDAELRDENRRR
jgi:hypothetical protein